MKGKIGMRNKILITLGTAFIILVFFNVHQNDHHQKIYADSSSVFGRLDTVTAGDSYSTNIESGAIS